MKKLFTMIRRGQVEEVRKILEKKPELIACTAKAPPRKDDGQSPLMVAIKSDNLEVAHLLLDFGADVNFVNGDEPTEPYSIYAPIWDNALGQCFLRANHTVSEASKARTEGYFQLLCRLLDLGMDINRELTCSLPQFHPKKAWRAALDYYQQFSLDDFARNSIGEMKREQQRQLQDWTARILEVLAAHGADIYDYHIREKSSTADDIDCIIRNLILNRELREGIRELTEGEQKYMPQWFEVKWRPMDAILRPYYAKDNPYYGVEVTPERRAFFERFV